jgi:hypothetical protein
MIHCSRLVHRLLLPFVVPLQVCGVFGQVVSVPKVENFGPRTLQTGIVSGLPFCARFEEKWSSIVHSGRTCRDSRGRTRQEVRMDLGGETLELVIVADPAAGTAHILRPEWKKAMRMILGPPGKPDVEPSWLFPGDYVEDVGGSRLGNLECRRVKVTSREDNERGILEVWIADSLRTVVLEMGGSTGEQRTWRLFDIERREPTRSLFELPTDYTVHDEPNFGGPPQ